MNNEPLELARTYLSGGAATHSPQSGDEAHRAVVLIDPFPNTAALTEPYQSDARLSALVLNIFSALKNQARFKPQELELAASPDVFSRFMIAPSRKDEIGKSMDPAIASGVMGGFGGFLHESFRRHDFQLGRRNCQAFLKWRFCLPAINPIVAIEDPSLREQFLVREPDGRVQHFKTTDGKEVPFLPIIPLVGKAAIPIPKPKPPSGKEIQLDALRKLVKSRVERVGATIIRSDLDSLLGGPTRFMLEKAWTWRLAASVTDKIMNVIVKQLALVR